MRYAVFTHDPDGDRGLGLIIGAFKTHGAACAKAEVVEARATARDEYVECIVLPLEPGGIGANAVVDLIVDLVTSS